MSAFFMPQFCISFIILGTPQTARPAAQSHDRSERCITRGGKKKNQGRRILKSPWLNRQNIASPPEIAGADELKLADFF
jgi:hypothetical protein